MLASKSYMQFWNDMDCGNDVNTSSHDVVKPEVASNGRVVVDDETIQRAVDILSNRSTVGPTKVGNKFVINDRPGMILCSVYHFELVNYIDCRKRRSRASCGYPVWQHPAR